MDQYNKENPATMKSSHEKTDFLQLSQQLMANLASRTQEIIKKRYGLAMNEGETLEKIGQDYRITRERVRQIIADAIRTIAADTENTNFQKVQNLLFFTVEKNNGIIMETEALKKLGVEQKSEANAVKFLADCCKNVKIFEEKGVIENCWVLDEGIIDVVKKTIATAEVRLNEEKKVLTDEEMASRMAASFPELSQQQILSYLSVSFRIQKNRFGKWGMRSWSEINPKGTREKIYLVLKEKNQPLHFTQIAKFIDEFRLGKKKAHPQTVHNELIKDDRFVLIGRGIYALAEWGYSEGTIKDVLKDILAKSSRPLEKEEILKEVFRIRKVKKATVMINLNNSSIFEKRDNSYTIRR